MPIQVIDTVGRSGLISDTQPQKLADGAWSSGTNVRFDGNTASKVKGSRLVQGSLSTSAYSLFAHTTFDGSQFLCYAGLARVYTVNNNTHYDLTRFSNTSTVLPYNADPTLLWTGGVLGGLLFMNNGVDVPQVQLTPTASCRLSDLPNWPTTVTTRAACIRAFKNYLIALDVTKGVIRYRQMVKWSAAAEPLTVPSTWDEADTTADAGETSLSETNGTVIDCLPLRDVNIVYKDDSIHGMQFIGNPFVFRFYQIFSSVGILAKRCVAAFENYHCFVGNDLDIYVHDGNTIRSIADDRWREYMRTNIDGSNYERLFVCANPVSTEIWIFLPTGADEYPSKVLLWNWRKDTWGERDVTNISGATVGGIESSDYVVLWSTVVDTWDTIGSTWSELDSLPPDRKLVLVNPDNTGGLIETEFGSQELGADMPFYLERRDMWAFTCKVMDGGRIVDLQSRKFVRRVRFRTANQTSTNDITYKVAVQDDLNASLVWTTSTAMSNGTAEVVVLRRGRFLSVAIESTGDTIFSLQDIEIELDASGEYM